jgi:flagellar biosynthesis chaperone FliJ
MDNKEQLQEALALGNRVNQLLKETIFLKLLQTEIDHYQDFVSRLSPSQTEEFRQAQTAKNTLLRFFEKMKGAVAAGEAAAEKLNQPASKKSGLL